MLQKDARVLFWKFFQTKLFKEENVFSSLNKVLRLIHTVKRNLNLKMYQAVLVILDALTIYKEK